MKKTILIVVTALLGATLSASAAVLLSDSRTTTNPEDDGFATPDVVAAGSSSTFSFNNISCGGSGFSAFGPETISVTTVDSASLDQARGLAAPDEGDVNYGLYDGAEYWQLTLANDSAAAPWSLTSLDLTRVNDTTSGDLRMAIYYSVDGHTNETLILGPTAESDTDLSVADLTIYSDLQNLGVSDEVSFRIYTYQDPGDFWNAQANRRVGLDGLVVNAADKVLLIGNSYANGTDPYLREFLSNAPEGEQRTLTKISGDGYGFNGHYNTASTLAAITNTDWEVIILQGHSTEASSAWWYYENNGEPGESFADYAGADDQWPRFSFWDDGTNLSSYIASHTTARIVYFDTWARHPNDLNYLPIMGPAGDGQAQAERMQDYTTGAYGALAAEFPGSSVAPVGEAWRRSYQNYPDIRLHHADDSHGNSNGYYLAAAVLYNAITGELPTQNDYDGELSAETARQMKEIADTFEGRTLEFEVLPRLLNATTISMNNDETMTVRFLYPPQSNVTVNVSLSDPARATVSPSQLTFTPDDYNIRQTVTVSALEGSELDPEASVQFGTVSDDPAFDGLSDSWLYTSEVGARMRAMVQKNIDSPWPGISNPDSSPGVFSYALACLYMGQNVEQANELILNYYTNNPVPDSESNEYDGYFWQHIMWRIYLDPAMNARLTPEVRSIIEENMFLWLNKRSHISEAQGTEWVYHGSENHDAMQKGSHLLCAQALKSAPAYGSNQVLADGSTIGEHAAAWTDYWLRYFLGRAKEGINAEIASGYARYTIGAYYNIMDFSDSPVLRDQTEKFITLYWADTASDWVLSGVRGGGETRCYKATILRQGSRYAFAKLFWGYGWHEREGKTTTYNLIPTVSSYRIPDIITACATDTNRPNFLYTSRRWGREGSSSGLDVYVTFDNGGSFLLRETWVTPDYAMGTITFDMNKDYAQILDQNRAMGVMFASGLDDRVMVFGKGGGNDKSYADLSGVTREDCMVAQRDKNVNNSGNGTLVFVPTKLWSNRVETGGWLFLETGDAFCAVKPATGGYTAAEAQLGYDLEMDDMWAPVIIQTGQASNYADFAAFQTSVMSNALTYAGGTMNYTSEAGDTFTFYANSKTTPKVNGTTVNLNPDKTYDSPYLSMVHGEEVATVSYPGYADLELDFSLPPVISTLAPDNNASNTPLNTPLVATFSKPVQAGTGSITLKKRSDDSTVETFDVTDPSVAHFDGTQLTLVPGNNLQLDTAYYIEIPESAVQDLSGTPYEGFSGNSHWSFSTIASNAIVLVNSASKVVASRLHNSSTSFAFDANADMIIVAVSTERSGGDVAVRYDGHTLSNAVNTTQAGIWYLDLTATDYAGGSADLVIDFTDVDTVNGVGVGVVSVSASGAGIDLHATETAASNLVLSTSRNGTFNIVSFNANNSGSPSVDAPLTEIYASGSIGSAQGAAGYQANVPAGEHSYSWTTTDKRKVVAAAFALEGYGLWALSFDLADGATGNDDGDALDNLSEYALGGNPTNAADLGYPIHFTIDSTNATYVHPQLSDPDSGIRYVVETTDNLVSNVWEPVALMKTNANGYAAGFDLVTSQIPTLGKKQQFIRLKIEKE